MLLSKSAYARHMGVSRQTVYSWIARGEIVISGDKVDVEASQAKQNSAGAGEHQTEMTWAQAAAWVWGHDVQHEPAEQLLILFRQDEETHSFYGKDRAAGALRFLRSELAYVATMHPDTLDDWNKTGLMSLCLLDSEKL